MRFIPEVLSRKWGRAGARLPRIQEPADLGTCFGLEAWLDDDELDWRSADEAKRPNDTPLSWLLKRVRAN